ncbi:MAG: hypothetical protein IIB38_10220 [Candidatus Hydrogenedentes bacterium]|nr:hypothetical protein [Candidatus Hydrogenedentota bacterium]
MQIADLSDSLLGIAALNIVWIDRDAAGYGWSVNSGGVDLFSAVTHEFGHVLGFRHDEMSATLGASVRQLASSRFPTGLDADDGPGSVRNIGMSTRFDGFFSLSREWGLSDPFGTTPFATRWADTTDATNQRDRLFEALASHGLQPAGFVGLRNSNAVDADLSGKDEESSRLGDLLSGEDLDRLFADFPESLEDEIFWGMTSPE